MYSYRTLIVNFAPTNPTQCELDKTIKNQVEVVLASVNQRPQGISKELDKKTEEKQISLQVEKKFLYTQKRASLETQGTRGRAFMMSSTSRSRSRYKQQIS
jgi:hypothetical protein